MKIALVAGETSGDILGAGLVAELRQRFPHAEFVGIAGPLMQKQGVTSLADMEKLSIMGLDGLFGSLREILQIRSRLIDTLLTDRPDVFIGIDAPDFNLTVEQKMRDMGIPAVHYVSPTVWAWRSYRIHKIRRSVDLMLTLFPFEADFYRRNNVPVKFVGHPITKRVEPFARDVSLREQLLGNGEKLVAVLPGSRRSELKRLGALFVSVMRKLHQQDQNLRFVVPLANENVGQLFRQHLHDQDRDFLTLVEGAQSLEAMGAADVVLLASGTAALESALLARPTVVAYRLSWLTYWFARATTTVKHASMPNHLLDQPIVPELIQSEATEGNLVKAVQRYLRDPELCEKTSQQLATIHAKLDFAADQLAADAIVELLA